MTSVLSSHHRVLKIRENSLKNRISKVQYLGYSGVEFPSGGALSYQGQHSISYQEKIMYSRLVLVRAVSGDEESSNSDDDSPNNESNHSENEEVKGGLSREDLERLVGQDDATFSGVDLATLIRKKYGRSYDVQLIKKEFMGRNLLAMNVMWKYMEQAVSIFIDMDESGGRANEWIYK